MAQFPESIYTPRVTENLPGIVFDPDDKVNFYSEDFQSLGDEVNAIETFLETYKKLTCKITQQGHDDPVIYVFENTLGFDPIFTRVVNGVYAISANDWADMNQNGIHAFLSVPSQGQMPCFSSAFYNKEDSTFYVETCEKGGSLSDDLLSDGDGFVSSFLEIRVYNN